MIKRLKLAALSSTLLCSFACASLQQAVMAEDMTAEQIYERGWQENQGGQYGAAIADFTTAIKMKPDYWKAYANRGAAKYHSHDYGSALQDFNTAIPNLPSIPALNDLKRLTEEAIANNGHPVERVVVRQPVVGYRGGYNVPVTAADNVANLASIVMSRGYKIPNNLIHPMGENQHLIHPMGGPTDSEQAAQTLFDHGCEKAKTMDFAGAIKDFDECIKLNPKHGLAYANRGSAREQIGDKKGAIDDLNKAVELLPDNAGVKETRDRLLKAA